MGENTTASHAAALPEAIQKLATSLSLSLDDTQLNIGGERALMSPNKFVLTGTTDEDRKIVLKCATHPAGVREIVMEHEIREALRGFPFAVEELRMPEELFWGEKAGYMVSITAFIEQPHVFTDYTVREQFFMAVHAFEAQESFHATTAEHHQSIRDHFLRYTPDTYLNEAGEIVTTVCALHPTLADTLKNALRFLQKNTSVLEAYDGYLIHTDFVPHNMRIAERQLYLLDFVSFRLANKYETHARFINFMEVHSPALVPLLTDYIKKDRGEHEYLDLRLMRVFKILFLLKYYTSILPNTDGDLCTLTELRIQLWHDILSHVLDDKAVPAARMQAYYEARAELRTEEEKARQRQFTWT